MSQGCRNPATTTAWRSLASPLVRLFPTSLALALLLLAGCAVTPASLDKDLPPNHRAMMASYFHKTLLDPYSVRDAEISEPFVIDTPLTGSFVVICTRFNAKNAFGGYTGIKTEAYGFRARQIQAISSDPGRRCRSARFTPFAELEQL